jgi:phospholipid transport system substrate-binding protein
VPTADADLSFSVHRTERPIQGHRTHLRPRTKRGPRSLRTPAPVIEQTFDLNAVLATSIGLGWPSLPNDQTTQLHAAFLRYTVGSYAANCDSHTSQIFQISPTVRSVGKGDVVLQTKIVPTDGSATQLAYVIRNGQSGRKVVDVLADGSVSPVAVRRPAFRHLLTSGGVPALMVGPRHTVASVSSGMLP